MRNSIHLLSVGYFVRRSLVSFLTLLFFIPAITLASSMKKNMRQNKYRSIRYITSIFLVRQKSLPRIGKCHQVVEFMITGGKHWLKKHLKKPILPGHQVIQNTAVPKPGVAKTAMDGTIKAKQESMVREVIKQTLMVLFLTQEALQRKLQPFSEIATINTPMT